MAIVCRLRLIYKLINLMTYFPVLKGKSQSSFSNPLSGFLYNNTKYVDSCVESVSDFFQKAPHKSQSLPHTFFKDPPRQLQGRN